ncbi:hypothetical protein AXX12_17250 [Anaerosporomusa subterranea]|uniref:Lipoprotein LPP20-like domain-containing protein n=1 Tax=Anaerosporomusa subterranea TaxID=1794912 RepID=A0A154BWG6_ANASB|nr:LPP20 family lipoprotein [Anaerosporomusa subterranea]KYZ77808.1 hypothetical protein AXX12_17250 [Anaerosporomusa subterranea]
MSRKAILVLALCFLLVASLPIAAGANPTAANNVNILIVSNAPGAVQEVANGNGQINWETDTVEAVGTGVPSANVHHPAQSKGSARRAAIVDAQRNLLEAIKGVQVDSETTMENLAIASDTVKTRVSGLVRGARIVREQELPDGSYQVIMVIKMYGHGGLAGAIEDRLAPTIPQPLPPISSTYTPSVVDNQYQYTGLVIDARGLDLERSMGPMVFDTEGRVIYGNMYVERSYVIDTGLVDYASSADTIALAEKGQSRAGKNPLFIKAVAVKDHNRNVIISKADGDAVLAASSSTGFLTKCAVVLEH